MENGIPMLRKLDRAVIEMVHKIRKSNEDIIMEAENLFRTISFLIKQKDIEKYNRIISESLLKLLVIYDEGNMNELFGLDLFKELLNFITNGGDKNAITKEIDIHANRLRTLVTNFAPYDSVRGVFLEGGELYPDAGFREKNHIQICVRNNNCIKGFFIPKNMDDNYPNP